MKKVIFIQNITLEGPGMMERYLEERNIPFQIIDVYRGEALPSHREEYGAVVVLGGPMNIYEEQKYPFLASEKGFLDTCISKEIPVLGLCLGAQLLADVLGATVTRNEIAEVGWMNVELTPEGEKNALFEDVPSLFTVFQWHGDTFAIPEGAEWLAQSILCRNQAFSYKDRVFGLQFHIEVDDKTAKEWADYYLPELVGEEKEAALEILHQRETGMADPREETATLFFNNFFGKIAGYE
jgi:GMP synthase (glutamine-hydrolysing)